MEKDLKAFPSRGNGATSVTKGPQVGCSACMMQHMGHCWLPEPLGCALWAPAQGWARAQHLWEEGLHSGRAGEGAAQKETGHQKGVLWVSLIVVFCPLFLPEVMQFI